MNQTRIQIQVNYLGPNIQASDIQAILDIGQSTSTLTAQRLVLEAFFGLPLACINTEMLERYVVATSGLHIMPFPVTERILERLLKPLKSAKRNYCFGDYMATVAASGVVAEMLAVLIWKIRIDGLQDHPLTKKDRNNGVELGSAFENLGQQYRVEALKDSELIESDDKSMFSAIRNLRKPYLHWWSTDPDKEQSDALEAYSKAFILFRKFVGPRIGDGGVMILDPKLLEFIQTNPL
jgi:hypothetical protein